MPTDDRQGTGDYSELERTLEREGFLTSQGAADYGPKAEDPEGTIEFKEFKTDSDLTPQQYADQAALYSEAVTPRYRGAWGDGNEARLRAMLEQAGDPAPEALGPNDRGGMGSEVRAGWSATLPAPDYIAQETGGPMVSEQDEPHYRPLVADGSGSRKVDEKSLHDLRLWGRTVAYLVDTGAVHPSGLSEIDRRALEVYRVEGPADEPAEAGDGGSWTDDIWARAIYTAALAEPHGPAVPPWDALSGDARKLYRRQARRTRELVAEYRGDRGPVT
jgi:hypothetical protein